MAAKHFTEAEGLFDTAAPIWTSQGETLSVDMTDLPIETDAQDPCDYTSFGLSDDERASLQRCRNRIVKVLSAAAIDAGFNLLEAKRLIKDHCPRGSWSIWLKTSLGVSESTARNFMAAAEWAAKTPTVGEMSPGAIYLGATAPAEVQAVVVQKIEAGAPVSACDIKQMIVAYRQSGNLDADVVRLSDEHSARDGEASTPMDPRTASSTGQRKANDAACELLARLRDHFEDMAIMELFDLMEQTSPKHLRQMILENA